VTGHDYNTISVIAYNIVLKLFLVTYMGTVRKDAKTDTNFTTFAQHEHFYTEEKETRSNRTVS